MILYFVQGIKNILNYIILILLFNPVYLIGMQSWPIGLGIASQANAQSEIENDKRFQLVNKLEFKSPIKYLAIGSENSVSFARVILTKDAIIFRNKKKEVISKYPIGKGSYLISSPSSEYSAVVSTIKGIEDKNDTGLSRLDFYDRSGKVLWQKDYELS